MVTQRPVAQKQSARLISGRPRSVTAPDDHLTIRKPITERTPMKIAKALKLKNQLVGDIAQLKEEWVMLMPMPRRQNAPGNLLKLHASSRKVQAS